MNNSPAISKDRLKNIFDQISENELFVCSLCASMCTNQNKHQLVSTQCGHLFGKNCIRKRLKQTNQCPMCEKSLTTRREQQLRTMCLSSVVTIFPIEISRMRDERRKLRSTFNRRKTSLEQTQRKLSRHQRQLKRINENLLRRRAKRRKGISKVVSNEK